MTATIAGPRPATGKAVLLLLSLSVIWGVNWPVMKLAVDELPVLAFRTFCLLIAGGGMLAIARAARLPLSVPPRERRPLLWLALTNTTLWCVFSAFALAHLPAGRAAILAYTMPLWAALLAVPLLGERLRWTTLAGLGIGLAAMAVLIAPDWRTILASPVGTLAMLAAAMSWAAAVVVYKGARFTLSTIAITGWQYILGGAPVMVGALWLDSGFDYGRVSALAWASTLFSATLPLLFCQWAYFRAIEILPASVAAIGTLAIPVVGVVSGALLLGEKIGADVIVALLLVVAALVLVLVVPALAPRRPRLAPSRPAR